MARIPARLATVLLGAAAIAGGFLSSAPSAQAPGGTIALTNARVFDGSGRAPIENATVLVVNGKIQEVGTAVKVPAGATRVDARGKTIIPGLINAHGHVGNTVGLEQGKYSAENVQRDLKTYAAYGVTTVFSLGDDQAAGIAARDSQKTPSLNRARLYVAGPVLAPKSVEEAAKLVNEVAAMKVDIVKIRVDDNLGTTPKMAPEIYKAVIYEAHKKGARVAVHLFYLDDAKAVLDAGADFIAHSVRDTEVDAPFIAMLKRRDVCYCPTLMREVSTFVYESTPPWFSDSLFTAHADMKAVELLKEPQRQEQMRQMMGGKVDQAMLDSPEVRRAVLDRLIDERVSYTAALKSGITVPVAELRSVIVDIPEFKDASGKFSPDLFVSYYATDSYIGDAGANAALGERRIRFEAMAYWLKWRLPLMLLVVALIAAGLRIWLRGRGATFAAGRPWSEAERAA